MQGTCHADPENPAGRCIVLDSRLVGMRSFWILPLLAGCASSGDSADDHYRLAEESFSAGDFQRSLEECERTLLLNPEHGAARELRREVQYLTRQPFRFSSPHDSERHTQILVEVEESIRRGRRAYPDSRDRAAREFRMVLEYAKWIPDSPGLKRLKSEAGRCLLSSTSSPEGLRRYPIRSATASSTGCVRGVRRSSGWISRGTISPRS